MHMLLEKLSLKLGPTSDVSAHVVRDSQTDGTIFLQWGCAKVFQGVHELFYKCVSNEILT